MKLDDVALKRINAIMRKLETNATLKLETEFDQDLHDFVLKLVERFSSKLYERLFDEIDINDLSCQ